MPATWTKEELILACSTFYEHPGEELTQFHPAIINLSNALRSAPINLDWPRDESYRPPDGVRSRVGNFRRLNNGDSNNVPQATIEVWNKYQDKIKKLYSDRDKIEVSWAEMRQIAPAGALPFIKGNIYKRSHIHDLWGGSRQNGISPSAKQNIIFIFTGESGAQHGYLDKWIDGVFEYVGEGQVGDMTFNSSNVAILNHEIDGKDILLFEQAERRSYVKYLGNMHYIGHKTAKGPDREGQQRKIIIFNPVPSIENLLLTVDIDGASTLPPEVDLESLRRKATQSSSSYASSEERKATYYKRSNAIKIYALARAKGQCEGCNNDAPFTTPSGQSFLEVHHINRLSDGGPDDPRWVIALCPNCHRKAHYSTETENLKSHFSSIVLSKEENYIS